MNEHTIPQMRQAGQFTSPWARIKDLLLDLGLYALANGHTEMVQALTTILQRRGLHHA
jgi:hypothetical protein